MTKLRGYIPTMTVVVFLAFASMTVNAGIIIGDRATTATTSSCEVTTTNTIVNYLTKFATFAKTGIIIGDRAGILVGDRSTTACTDRNGIIIGD